MPTSCRARPLVVGTLLALASAALAADDTALERKAQHFRDQLVERHLSREGIVLYHADLRTIDQDLVRGTYPDIADGPMFTGMFAAASCTRARVERDPAQALEDARRALDGLAFLMRVTGERGFLARTVDRDAGATLENRRGRKWLRAAPPLERYVFRADVSVDQYANGLLPAAAACAELFPERSRQLAVDFARHLLTHDMRLIDPEGQQTPYGDLSWRSGFGWNSIFQLTGYGAFVLAATLDPDPELAARRDRLRDHYRVPARSTTTNFRLGPLTSFSNDLMAFNLYRVLVPIARASGDPALEDLRHGLHRSWLRVRDDRNAYFAAVMCHVEPESCDRRALAHARDLLARFPLEKRRLELDPALAEIPRGWLPDRKGRRQAARPVPIELRPVSSFEWKSNPYRVHGSPTPQLQFTGTDFLVAYWLLRLVEAELPPE